MHNPEISPPALSVQLKEKRDAAILEKHKEGMSNREIAKLFRMSPHNGHKVVADVIKETVGENADSVKSPTPEVSTSTVPMASTEDRSETREDARSFIDEHFEKWPWAKFLSQTRGQSLCCPEDGPASA